MLVGTDDGRVNEQFFEVGIALQRFGDTMPNAVPFPTRKTDIHRMPVAQFLRQISPRRSRSREVQNGFNKLPVICCPTTFIRWLAR